MCPRCAPIGGCLLILSLLAVFISTQKVIICLTTRFTTKMVESQKVTAERYRYRDRVDKYEFDIKGEEKYTVAGDGVDVGPDDIPDPEPPEPPEFETGTTSR